MQRIHTQILWAMAAGALFTCTTVSVRGDTGFILKDTPGAYLDVLLDGRIVARYMDAHDTSTRERQQETYKPYLHVFDAEGKAPITKGPGGLYTHHRGIFIGWNKIGFQGKTYDRWHMKGGDIVHQKFLRQQAGPNQATFTSLTEWNDEAGQPLLEEERTMSFQRALAPGRLLIDFVSKLKASRGDVNLDGDPEHAGIQYRPAQEVAVSETIYVFPHAKADSHKEVDDPWIGETYVLGDRHYSVVDMNHPDNPKGSRISAYRDYGRFGYFPTMSIKSGDTLALKYRFLIVDADMPPADVIQKCWDQFAGVAQPTPTPETCIMPAESKAAAKKGDAKKAGAKKRAGSKRTDKAN